MKLGILMILMVGTSFLIGCATKPVPKSRRLQVEQATETGPYSYQRAFDGPMR